MDINSFILLLNDPLITSFLFQYAASKGFDKIFKELKKAKVDKQRNSVEWQFLMILERATHEFCEKFEIEYDESSLERLITSASNMHTLSSKQNLIELLNTLLNANQDFGVTLGEKEYAFWIENFDKIVSEPQFISVYNYLNRKTIQEIETHAGTQYEILKYIPHEDVFPVFLTARPVSLTPVFLGRDGDVARILKKISCSNKALIAHGIGGIGKTELAKKILFDLSKTLSSSSGIYYLAWVPYKENIGLKKSICFSFWGHTQRDNIETLYLRTTKIIDYLKEKIILFIDNIDSNSDSELPLLSSFPCPIIATGRCNELYGLETYNVKELSKNNCKRLFYKFYTLEKNDSVLNKILEKCAFHTITIELVAKLACSEEITLLELAEWIQKNNFDIGTETVSATSYEKISKHDLLVNQIKKLFPIADLTPEEKAVLCKFSVMPNLPLSTEQAKKWVGIGRNSTINTLASRGWIQKHKVSNKIYYQMHFVIASAIQEQFGNDYYSYCSSLIKSISDDIERNHYEHGYQKADIIPYTLSIVEHTKKHRSSKDDATLLWRIGDVLRDVGDFENAYACLTNAQELFEKVCGCCSKEMADCLNSIGAILYSSGKEGAICYYQKALDIYKAIYGCEHIYLAKVYNNLGLAQLDISVESARNNFNSAFLIWKKEYGTNHPYTATAYSNLGLTYEKEENYTEALRCYETALEWRKKCLDPFHPEISTSYYNIALIYLKLKHPDLALDYMNKSYDICLQTLGSRHPYTIDALTQIQEICGYIN